MAAERKEPATGVLDEPAPIQATDGKLTAQAVAFLSGVLLGIVRKLNGLISFGDGTTFSWSGNIDGQWQDVVFPAAANTELVVRHGLNRLPAEVFFGTPGAACKFYSDRGSWTDGEVRLKCDTGNITVRILLV